MNRYSLTEDIKQSLMLSHETSTYCILVIIAVVFRYNPVIFTIVIITQAYGLLLFLVVTTKAFQSLTTYYY